MRSIAIILLVTAAACGSPERGDGDGAAGGSGVDEALRRDLLTRLEADQAVRGTMMAKMQRGESPDSMDVERVVTVDTANTRWLKDVVAQRGWPGRGLVGKDGADAAFLLAQHADRDTAFQASVIPLLERAHAAGEAEGGQLALLTDRIAVARGQPQVYGSQADIIDGRVIMKPIADSASVDERRARVGLPSLAQYVRMLDSLYTAPPKR